MDGVLDAGFVSIYKEIVYCSTAVGKVYVHKDPTEFHFGRSECCRIGITGGIITAVTKNEDLMELTSAAFI